MTKYGFVIDHRKCIGCHACTLACKSENLVPVGAFRTWVKYIEKGQFPNTRRFFTIERCQHCEDAPCVEICPTIALFKRRDGIVDFDSERCIGCKSCMQACPYDALYIDPNSHTAAKCNYCAHRTDRGLLPACVIVCPTKAIIAGDLDDGGSEIAETLARQQVQVRRPDQGTRPQVYYVGADEMIITPGMAAQPPMYMWSELGPAGVDLEPKGSLFNLARGAGSGTQSVAGAGTVAAESGDTRRGAPLAAEGPTADRGSAWAPVSFAPSEASTHHAVTVYDVAHPKPWGRKVASYLWTKSIGGGALAVAGPLLALGLLGGPGMSLAAAFLSLLFTALTTVLLVADLKRPDRFWRVVLTPNLRSWLPWGAYILIAFSGFGGLWLLAELLGQRGLVGLLLWPTVLLGLAAAGYSAFLFGQAEGRDFWQSPLLLPQLLGAAVLAGSASLAVVAPVLDPANAGLMRALNGVLLASVLATFGVVLAELYTLHANKDVAAAALYMKHGPHASAFWLGYVLVGAVVPAVLLLAVLGAGLPLALGALAAVAALVGLWFYEDAWVRAGQSVAMS